MEVARDIEEAMKGAQNYGEAPLRTQGTSFRYQRGGGVVTRQMEEVEIPKTIVECPQLLSWQGPVKVSYRGRGVGAPEIFPTQSM